SAVDGGSRPLNIFDASVRQHRGITIPGQDVSSFALSGAAVFCCAAMRAAARLSRSLIKRSYAVRLAGVLGAAGISRPPAQEELAVHSPPSAGDPGPAAR